MVNNNLYVPTATENAISAIGKICKAYENSNSKNNQFIIQWIQMLPITNDNEEVMK